MIRLQATTTLSGYHLVQVAMAAATSCRASIERFVDT